MLCVAWFVEQAGQQHKFPHSDIQERSFVKGGGDELCKEEGAKKTLPCMGHAQRSHDICHCNKGKFRKQKQLR